MNAHCKIGKITPKKLLALPTRPREEELCHALVEHATTIAGYYRDTGMAGFAVVAWGFDGSFSRGSRTHPDGFVGQTLAPSFVAEILRRDTAAVVTREVLDGDA